MDIINSLKNYKTKVLKKRIRELNEEIIALHNTIDAYEGVINYYKRENNRLKDKLQAVEDYIAQKTRSRNE